MKTILGTMTFGDQVDRKGAGRMIDYFLSAGGRELDTAYVYCKGETERLLGQLMDDDRRAGVHLATKVNPWNDNGLQPGEVRRQLEESLARLGMDNVDLLYLHAPDPGTPIETTLEACQDLYRQGKFREFGLSNFASWQVAEVVETCRRRGWMEPVVYQGLYNALNRDVEAELIPCLRHYGIRFYAYNPLAGGFLTGKHRVLEELPGDGRFADNKEYQHRYWKDDYFQALDRFVESCGESGLTPVAAAFGWLCNHSLLAADRGDGIILGASRFEQLQQNMDAVGEATLSQGVRDALDRGWNLVRPDCFHYFR